LHRVLDLKRGIPISLASIFILVARRLTVAIEGVNMPQCFLLKFRASRGEEQFVDAFRGGRFLTLRDCHERLAEASIPLQDEYLRAVSDREILLRMLGNLLRIYNSVEDQRRRDRVVAMMKLLD
jgi:regulator of sirC expression with transglutaminase-like and TPR domain